ncbi:hypothetical protein R3P38DRAFT_2808793 [Favolaschia claudopus]|uniref:Uncharacterized protein n=1 Tax=Favolaschia claudopus TaxID=2862362 RepID=A0AAV9ZFG9_9AGAR
MTVLKNIVGTKYVPNGPTNHGSLTAKGLTGLVDLLYGLERKPLELERLNGARRVDYHRGLATGNGELGTQSLPKGPQTRGIRGNNDSVGGNRGQHMKNASRI